jgi:hypothetical protein
MKYRHRKTGNIYQYISTVLDCTNSRGGHEAGRLMIVYQKENDTTKTYFARDYGEFYENFEKVES